MTTLQSKIKILNMIQHSSNSHDKLQKVDSSNHIPTLDLSARIYPESLQYFVQPVHKSFQPEILRSFGSCL